jgi:hypothetical protein
MTIAIAIALVASGALVAAGAHHEGARPNCLRVKLKWPVVLPIWLGQKIGAAVKGSQHSQVDAIQTQLVLEKQMKERALAELKVARDLASKAMMLAEQEGSTSPALPARVSSEQAATAPVSSVVKGWSTLCSTALTKVSQENLACSLEQYSLPGRDQTVFHE